jgi:hypothetical protein
VVNGSVTRVARTRSLSARPEQPIAAQTVHELLVAHVLRRGNQLRMPGDAELEKLARILEGWRLIFRNEQALRHRRALQEQAVAALKTANDVVRKIAEQDQAWLVNAVQNSAPPGLLRHLSDRVGAIYDVHANIERIAGSRALNEGAATYGSESWRWLATVLVEDFRNAMKAANPSAKFGRGHGGPAARFIAAVTPMLTGQEPKSSSVSTQLKRLARNKNPDPGNSEPGP